MAVQCTVPFRTFRQSRVTDPLAETATSYMSPVTEGPCRIATPNVRAPVSRCLPNSEGIGPKPVGLSRSQPRLPNSQFRTEPSRVTKPAETFEMVQYIVQVLSSVSKSKASNDSPRIPSRALLLNMSKSIAQSDEEKQRLLRLLESHGQQFLGSFDSDILKGKRKSSPEASREPKKRLKLNQEQSNEGSEQEWHGIAGEEASNFGESSSDEVADQESKVVGQPVTIFFSESQPFASSSQLCKASKRAFMSSKVGKVRQEVREENDRDGASDSDEDEHLTNLQNDALLHRLVHTKLLSGSLSNNLDLTPAQRRKALAGRVLEATGQVKLGKGESVVRSSEHNKAAKHIRDGILNKQKERSHKALEEAKNMGNYHPALKQLFDASASSKGNRKRERGLRMGVGSYSGGILKLGKSDIAAVKAGDPSRRGKPGKKNSKR